MWRRKKNKKNINIYTEIARRASLLLCDILGL